MRFPLLKIVVVAAGLAVVAVAVGPQAHASNMGFKMNRQIFALGSFPTGQNQVALPFQSPYGTAQDVCTALGLTAGSGRVQQVNAQAGTVSTFVCGGGGNFTLIPRVGIGVTNPTALSGILVGSHPPGQSVTVFALGAFPVGQNSFPVPYHTTAATAADVCAQAGLTSGAGRVQRVNAAAGTVSTFVCGGGGNFSLVLGEAVILTNPTSVSFVPAHF